LHPQTDLSLLLESLTNLSRTPYFNRALVEHTRALISVVQHVLDASPRYDDEIVRGLVDKVWTAHRYLQGSTTKESPYEIEYCLRFAIAEWVPQPCLVTTALTDEKDFHLKLGDPWDYVRATLPKYTKALPKSRLIFIGVPRLYKSMPLFCCALYHELGHFVDVMGQLTESTKLLSPIPDNVPDTFHPYMYAYRQEHFADLFAACYVGSAIGDSLDALNPLAGFSETHPATSNRLEVIETFLKGEEVDVLDMFQDALKRRGMPVLAQRFEVTDIEAAFDDMRPCVLDGPQQLHGIFPAGWSYMMKALQGDGATWTKGAKPLEIIRIINDLSEKSIRNASIRQLWKGAK
jgi:hypothetical protein